MNINISFEERDQLLNMDLDTGDSSMDNGFGEAMLLAGPPGMSAYEVALSNGFVGTEEQWLASLQGPQGPRGEAGLTGPQGERGLQGERGEAGPEGPQGLVGPTGPAGPQGIQGIQGIRGEKGEQGDPGIQGPAGQDGRDGKDGKDGIDGRDGVSATHSWNDTVLTITSASGTSSADLQGARGAAGKDGYTPIRGTDYWTEADRREIVEEVATEIPAPVVSWNDLEDKPFSKEVDPAVYTTSTLGQLEYPKHNAEDYTHGTKLCETTYMPGSVSVTVDNFVPNKSVPLVPTNQYYALGKFEINGRKFGIYSAYMGRGYELYLLGMSSDGLYGQTFRVSDIAKIKYFPTEYINIVELKSLLGLPLPVYDGEVVPV